MIEVEIHQIRGGRDGSSDRCLILRPKDHEDRRWCPIIIGVYEATAILAPGSSPAPSRPMTHDLLFEAIKKLGGTIQHIHIRGLDRATFYADIAVEVNGESVEIDARPSDSIALAIRADVPIFVAEEVLEQVTRDLEQRMNVDEVRPGSESKRERRHEEAGSPVTPEQREKLSVFSEFTETLSIDDEEETST